MTTLDPREIEDFALLSDCASAALVDRGGSVEWLCWPHFASSSVFGRLLDPRAGHWTIAPVGDFVSSRSYEDDSLVLSTIFTTESGSVRLTDALALGFGERGHDLGRSSPNRLLRHVECLGGSVKLRAEFEPRTEYGLFEPLLKSLGDLIVSVGGPDRLTLASTTPLSVDGGDAFAEMTLEAGQSHSFALAWSAIGGTSPTGLDATEVPEQIRDTVDGWRSWSAQHQNYEGPWRELVMRSGLVLRGLTFVPTGAIVAAATTSLPEVDGGQRNWDYRYTWVRDASLTLEALWVAACPDEARDFFSFLAANASADLRAGKDLQIMFGVDGAHDLAERELPHLSGWRNSRPVRVGNGAATQRQTDVYGELLAAALTLRDKLVPFDDDTRDLLVRSATRAAELRRTPDQGIWEIRGEPRHFTHSKLMCWVALDRAVALADDLGVPSSTVTEWTSARREIAAEIAELGFNSELGSFTQSFGSDSLDASTLLIPIYGMLPGTDPRVRGTISAIERDLTDDRGYVYRYRSDDGLAGEEGAFVICTFWLAHAHALAGNVDRAGELFELAAGSGNDLGLMAEMVDPRTAMALGNYPQAFSHVGLVGAAWAILRARASA